MTFGIEVRERTRSCRRWVSLLGVDDVERRDADDVDVDVAVASRSTGLVRAAEAMFATARPFRC